MEEIEIILEDINEEQSWGALDPNVAKGGSDPLPQSSPIPRYPVTQDLSIYDVAVKDPPYGWDLVFKNPNTLNQIKDISNILEERENLIGKKVYPLREDLFNAFHYTTLRNVKVVIFGQDPYPQTLNNGLPKAMGLSFSVRPYDSIPVSLKNIYKELENSIEDFIPPSHGDLTSWAKQGVLLLNTCLTLDPGVPNSHGKDLWMGFIKIVLNVLGQESPDAVYLLLGRNSQSLNQYINNRSPKIETSHPSGQSAYHGFIGSNIFKNTNQILLSQGKTPIDWRLP